jgi:hypothetical protein
VPHMEWWCQGHTLTSDMKVLALESMMPFWGMIGLRLIAL